MKIFFGVALLLLGLQGTQAKIPNDSVADNLRFPVEKYKLDNGLTVLLHEDHSAPIVSYNQWFRVGSRNERPGRTGLAHFFEHLMFKGTKKYPGDRLERIIQAHGGTNNAFTSHDYTGYYENMPSGTLDLVVDIESDRMRNLLFKKKVIQKEREVVKEERRYRVENNVSGYLNEAVYETVFRVHPYRWPVLGSMGDLNAATIDDLKDFYKTYYAPNNAIISIVGDFEPKKAKKLIKKHYGPLKAQPLPDREIPQEPEQKGHRSVKLVKEVQNPTVAVAFKGAEAGDSDGYVLDIISNILGTGESSRLYERLVYKQQQAMSVSTSSYTPKDPGVFKVVASVKPGKDERKVLRSIYSELYKLRKHMVSEEELKKAKNQIMNDHVDSLKTMSGKGRYLALYEILLGSYKKLFTELDRYNAVTRKQVKKVAQEYLKPTQRSVIRVVPEGRQKQSGQTSKPQPDESKKEGA